MLNRVLDPLASNINLCLTRAAGYLLSLERPIWQNIEVPSPENTDS
jgi:hypothetical protein